MEDTRKRRSVMGMVLPTVIMIAMLGYFIEIRYNAGEYDGVLVSILFYLSLVTYVLIMVEEYKKFSKAQTKKEPLFVPKQLFLALGIILYIPLQMLLGFIVSTFLFTLVIQIKLGVKKWSTRIFVSLLMAIGLWLGFEVALNLKLPLGIFGLLEVFGR